MRLRKSVEPLLGFLNSPIRLRGVKAQLAIVFVAALVIFYFLPDREPSIRALRQSVVEWHGREERRCASQLTGALEFLRFDLYDCPRPDDPGWWNGVAGCFVRAERSLQDMEFHRRIKERWRWGVDHPFRDVGVDPVPPCPVRTFGPITNEEIAAELRELRAMAGR